MSRFNIQAVVALLFFAATFRLVASQIVSPFATHDCSSQVVYTGDHACNNDLTRCCAATGQCCAGGCCPYNAYCVFVGTANEACCSLSDKTQCGEAPPPSTKTCPASSAPSVPCSGVGSSWYCAPHCTCNNSVKDGCNCLTGCSPGSNGGGSSSAAAASSTVIDSSPAAASSTESSAETQTSAAAVATTTATSSTTAATVAAATTTKASVAERANADSLWTVLFLCTVSAVLLML